ncbi:isochorismatase family protein [Martelella sp. FLE1502]
MIITAIIDLQERLVPAMAGSDAMVANAAKLVAGSQEFARPIVVTEQNPDKLGGTVADLQIDRETAIAKMSFDSSDMILRASGAVETVVLAGCEAHICVRQTVRGLRARGIDVVVAVDAIGSRKDIDYRTALQSMHDMDARLETVESILFDWLGTAEHDSFRKISRLIR